MNHASYVIAGIDPADADLLRAAGGIPYIAEPPLQLTRRTLSVRGFDAADMMLDAALIAGGELSATIERLLDNSDIDHLHIHNEPRGCWAARVERAFVPAA